MPAMLDNQCNGRYLLVVDSNIDDLIYTSMLLQRFSYLSHIAKTAREAFFAASTARPAFIISALDLADLHGLDLMRLLKKNHKTIDIPFIILRKPADTINEYQCLNAGAVDCLTKPVSAEELYHSVQKVLSTVRNQKNMFSQGGNSSDQDQS